MTKFIKILLCLSTLSLVAQNNFNQFDDKGERHGPWRKFFKNTCQWVYKGSECQYPGPGSLPIPGTFPPKTSNANPIFANNQAAVSDSDDECSKSYEACRIRNNTVHFGAFPGTGRQIPKQ